MHPAPALLVLLLIAACGEFPTAGAPTGRGDYPALLPIDGLLAGLPETEAEAEAAFEAERAADAALLARAEALEARADTLLAETP